MEHITTQSAKKMREQAGFSKYQGELLVGPRHELNHTDESFPDSLRRIPNPPKKLYMIGNICALKEGLAVVGARKATPYGLFCAKHFASLAAARGITIISGGAIGCDSAAHQGALELGGKTVVFLGGGCDELYPAKNKDLFQKIIDSQGAIVSEYPWDYPPLPHTFRARNRLIAGLSRATLIVEAGLPSGTFSTADEALNASKEVLAIPGSIFSKSSHGANRLIYQGAIPIVDDEGFNDVICSIFELLRQETYYNPSTPLENISLLEKTIYEYVSAQPMNINDLFHALSGVKPSLTPPQLNREITQLELKGLIARYPDGTYGGKQLLREN